MRLSRFPSDSQSDQAQKATRLGSGIGTIRYIPGVMDYRLAAALENIVLALVPSNFTETMQTMAISASIRPYSTIVAPSSPLTKFLAAAMNLVMDVAPGN